MKRVLFVALAVGLSLVSLPRFVAAEDGAEIFVAQKCNVCHSINGVGNIKPGIGVPLDGVGSKLKAEEIREWIVDPVGSRAKAGSTKLPAMIKKKLTDEQVTALVKYLSTLKK